MKLTVSNVFIWHTTPHSFHQSAYKMINKISMLPHAKLFKTHQFELGTFQVLSSHVWSEATLLHSWPRIHIPGPYPSPKDLLFVVCENKHHRLFLKLNQDHIVRESFSGYGQRARKQRLILFTQVQVTGPWLPPPSSGKVRVQQPKIGENN